MAVRIYLGDADRERLGAPEFIEWDPSVFTLLEAELVQRHGWDPDDLLDALISKPKTGTDGETAGYVVDWRARRVMLWLAARRAGLKVPLDEFDLDMRRLRWQTLPDPDAVAEEVEVAGGGKDPSSPPSEPSESPA